jgi:ElaB/YqjD/DUF883 family membrane-anchored ribosome-binding protein
MFDSSELRDELQALKGDLSRLLNTTSDEIFDASKTRAEALADQIKSALNELSQTLSEQEGHIEKLISDRPIDIGNDPVGTSEDAQVSDDVLRVKRRLV